MRSDLFKLYESILNEDSNNLYHFTTIDNLLDILNSGKLKVNEDPKISGSRIFKQYGYPAEGISTTRNKNLVWGRCNIRLVLNKQKIKQRYKIIPLHWYNMRYGDMDYRVKGNISFRNNIPVNQSEERIITTNGLPTSYIEEIDLINNPNGTPLTKKEIDMIKNITNVPVVNYQ